MKTIWLTTTIILFCASTFFSVQLLTELAETPESALAYAAVAVALAMVQYAVLPRAINQWQQRKRISASTGFITWALLTLLSIAASAAALIGDTRNHQQTALTQSTEYKLLISQIDQLQQQSLQLQQTARIDTENGYRARAIAILDKNTALQKQIADLRGQLATLAPEQSTAAHQLFQQIGKQVGYPADAVMSFAYIAIAILLELALTVSVTALTEQSKPEVSAPTAQAAATDQPTQKLKPAEQPVTLIARLLAGQPVTSASPA